MKNTSSLKREEVQRGIHCLPERRNEGLGFCRAHTALQRHGPAAEQGSPLRRCFPKGHPKTLFSPPYLFKISFLLAQIAQDDSQLPSSPTDRAVRVFRVHVPGGWGTQYLEHPAGPTSGEGPPLTTLHPPSPQHLHPCGTRGKMLWNGATPLLQSYGVKNPSTCWWHRGGLWGRNPLGGSWVCNLLESKSTGVQDGGPGPKDGAGAHSALGTRGGTKKQERDGCLLP